MTEYLTLMQALHQGLARSSLDTFYHLARAILVKSEAYYDQYDQVFAHYFKDAELAPHIRDEVMKWLEDPAAFPEFDFSPELLARLGEMDLETLRRELEERLAEQTERVALRLPLEDVDKASLLELRRALSEHPGRCPVALTLVSEDFQVTLNQTGLLVAPVEALKASVERLFGAGVCLYR